jgi:uncharacterized tellurite resistance protein B-like protein
LPLGFEKTSSLPDQEQAMSLTEDGAPTSRKPRYGWRDREHWVATQLNSASWSAIFAGAICGLAIYLVLGLFGFAAGIGAIDPAEEANPVSGVPSSLGFFWLLMAIVAFFAAGWISGRLAGFQPRMANALHGLTVGALTLLAVVYLASSTFGAMITGVAGALSSAVTSAEKRNVTVNVRQPEPAWMRNMPRQTSGTQANANQPGNSPNANASRAVQSAAQSANGSGWEIPSLAAVATYLQFQTIDQIRREATQLINASMTTGEQRQTAEALRTAYQDLLQTPGNASEDIQALFRKFVSEEGAFGPQDRENAKAMIAEQLGMTPAEADRVIARWGERYNEVVTELEKTSQAARKQLAELAERGVNRAKAMSENAMDLFRQVVSREEQRETRRIVAATFEDIRETPYDAASDLSNMLDRLFAKGGSWGDDDAAQLRKLIGEQTGWTEQEVSALVDRWQTRYNRATGEVSKAYQTVRTETIEATDATLDAVAETSAWAAVAMLFALGAAVFGGWLGRPEYEPDHDDATERV